MSKLSILTASLTATETFNTEILNTEILNTEIFNTAPWPRPAASPWDRPARLLGRARDSFRSRVEAARVRRQQKCLEIGQTLHFGSAAKPLDPANIASLLAPLKLAPAGAIHFTVEATAKVPHLLSMLEADQHHALQVDLLLAPRDLASVHAPDWRLLQSLTDLGIATRVGVRFAPGLSAQEFHLHSLFENALAHGAFDLFPVVLKTTTTPRSPTTPRSSTQTAWSIACERLRLKFGCPRLQAGRG